MDRARLTKFCSEQGFPISDVALDGFESFEESLYAANEIMNLTRVPRQECTNRHFIDSLLSMAWIPLGAFVLDIGTGPGLPAWPLACARPDLQVVALDSSTKMLGHLENQPLENLAVAQARAEEYGCAEVFDWVTGRALAPLGIQLELSCKPCKIGGLIVPFRTPAEIETIHAFPAELLGLQLMEVKYAKIPEADVERCFPFFKKIEKTKGQYPRSWAQIKQAPIGQF